MIRPNYLSPKDRLELERCVRRHREDHGIARRANALLLLDDGESCAQIAKFLYLDDDTIRGWHEAYRQDGWDALALDGWQGGQSHMTVDQEAKLCTWLDGRFCRSAGEIRTHIKAKFALCYSHSGCLKLLRRIGFEYRKPKGLPHVADVRVTNQKRRPYEQSEAVLDIYRWRAGIEATMSHFKHQMNLANLRVRGMPAMRYAVHLKALGLNIHRCTRVGLGI